MKEKELVLTRIPIKSIQCLNKKGERITVQLTGKETIREAMDIISTSYGSEGVQELSEAINKGLERAKRA